MMFWSQVEDPWTESLTLDRSAQNPKTIYHGEGSLLSPRPGGRLRQRVRPSLRLKALRDGSEDYEYLALLRRAGQGDAAMKLVQAVARSWFDWERDLRRVPTRPPATGGVDPQDRSREDGAVGRPYRLRSGRVCGLLLPSNRAPPWQTPGQAQG